MNDITTLVLEIMLWPSVVCCFRPVKVLPQQFPRVYFYVLT